ncbi:hypothetical protein NM688_g7144 [Phlebia brevispora]|uniref:Uncharacterized protein n=1 Tax=Phlebia brevispora TaxID=194682 RepID=A0ACC1S8N5_9APHY|nr:hypothetical protein NM688_g7144 [Phlebia brevispora]
MSNPGNVARGLKAAISNPNNSEEARERAQERLDEMNSRGQLGQQAHEAQIRTGHKAAINNPNVSLEAKQHSREVVEDLDVNEPERRRDVQYTRGSQRWKRKTPARSRCQRTTIASRRPKALLEASELLILKLSGSVLDIRLQCKKLHAKRLADLFTISRRDYTILDALLSPIYAQRSNWWPLIVASSESYGGLQASESSREAIRASREPRRADHLRGYSLSLSCDHHAPPRLKQATDPSCISPIQGCFRVGNLPQPHLCATKVSRLPLSRPQALSSISLPPHSRKLAFNAMSPGSAVEQVKTRFTKLKLSSTNTLNKLRRRKSVEKRASTGSLGESHNVKDIFVGANRRSSSAQSLGDASFSRRRGDDDSSVYSFGTHASSSESVVSDGQKLRASTEAREAETRSVGSGSGSGSCTTTVSDSTFPHTPEQSFKNNALPPSNEDDGDKPPKTLEPSDSDVDVSRLSPIPTIEVDSGDLEEDVHAEDETFAFTSSDEEILTDAELAAQSPAFSLLAGPLETIYEVDSCVGSQTGLSTLPSGATRSYQSSSSSLHTVDLMPVPEIILQANDPIGPISSISDAMVLMSVSKETELQDEHTRMEPSDDVTGIDPLPHFMTTLSVPYDEPSSSSNSALFEILPRPHCVEDPIHLGVSETRQDTDSIHLGNVPSLAVSHDDAAQPSIKVEDYSSQSDISDEMSPPFQSFTIPLSGGEHSNDKYQLELDALKLEETSRSRSMSDISGIEYFSAIEGPSIYSVDAASPNRLSPRAGVAAALIGVSHALETLDDKDHVSSLFARDSSIFATSTPASLSCDLPQEDDMHRWSDMEVSSQDSSAQDDAEHPDTSLSASSDAEYNAEPSSPSELVQSVERNLAKGVCSDDALQVVPQCPDAPRDVSTMPAPHHKQLLPSRYPSTYVSSCVTFICSIVCRSIVGASATSYLSALPPILRLYTVNRSVFLAPAPFASSSLVDSLSSTWHADDVDVD